MKANELMIGDWVLYLGHPHRVKEIYPHLISLEGQSGIDAVLGDFAAFIEDIQPIPLTVEILEKNGFQWGYTSDEEDIQASGEGDFEKGWVWDEGAGSVKVIFPDGTDSGEVLIDDQRFDKLIQFLWKEQINVHELQHALRLGGIEKEVLL